MNCPSCDRLNPPDALFCNRCGARLRKGGVTYRNRQQTQPWRVGQAVLAFSLLLLAGAVVVVGAMVLVKSGQPGATPTSAAAASSSPSLPPFVQPTPTVLPSPSPPPSPTPPFVLPTPSVSPSLPIESPSPSAGPTPTPTAAPTPTPEATPVDCAVQPGTNIKTIFLGIGNPESRGPLPKTWCVRSVTIRHVSGFGTARLLRDGRLLFEASCAAPGACPDSVNEFSPPRRVRLGSTLIYGFVCADDPATIEVDECTDATPDGATIQIDYEPIAGP